jgi:hypothetical protein
MSTFMNNLKRTVAALGLTLGVILSGSALADSAKFDGTWSVQLVAGAGLCGSASSQFLTIRNGRVRAGGSVSVSGQVGPSGFVSLALQRSGIQGSASGTLSGASGSGSWSVSSLGCSGSWTARRA